MTTKRPKRQCARSKNINVKRVDVGTTSGWSIYSSRDYNLDMKDRGETFILWLLFCALLSPKMYKYKVVLNLNFIFSKEVYLISVLFCLTEENHVIYLYLLVYNVQCINMQICACTINHSNRGPQDIYRLGIHIIKNSIYIMAVNVQLCMYNCTSISFPFVERLRLNRIYPQGSKMHKAMECFLIV